ncbi:MAG: 4Fe-4S binding protein [Alphaproteobacteria bacterium]
MLNIISKAIKVYFILLLYFAFSLSVNAQAPSMLANNKEKTKSIDEKILNDTWLLPQYINGDKKTEIEAFVLPDGAVFGKVLQTQNVPPIIEVLKNNQIIGYAFETYDWVEGLGYSRKPYHIIVGIDLEGKITGVRLMWHTEPIAILGRTDEDLHEFLSQLKGININKGISIVLGLSDSVLEGDKIAMRGTAGDISQLQQVDGISRTTTTSLLLNDAVMRSARKVARYKNIILDDRDLGTILNLELFEQKDWNQLLEEQSISTLKITNGDIVKKFEEVVNFKAPRSARLSKEDGVWTQSYMAIVNPEGIGANILGRRWYDQYVVSGRNVDDLVIWVGFLGPASFYEDSLYGTKQPIPNLKIKQDGKIYQLTPDMYKPLPFNHAKNAPDLIEQGLFYFSKAQNLNPSKNMDIQFFIKAAKELGYKENNTIKFMMNYKIPDRYINKNASIEKIDNEYNWKDTWYNKSSTVILSFLTVLLAAALLIFKDFYTKNRKIHQFIRILFLSWVLIWLGWVVGGQVSIIHLAAFIQAIFDGKGFSSFLAEPAIVIIGLGALISMPIWGRALFCGWLCPFGALQELLNKIALSIGIKQKRLNLKKDLSLKKIKYIVLAILGSLFLYSFDLGLTASAIEPFKSAITFRFNAPIMALVWVLIILGSGLFIERAYCRFLCPLGAAAAIIGKVRIFNFLHRRKECGSPCKACNPECPTQAIKLSGAIDMNECFQCLDCQVMYFDKHKCPPLVAKHKKI